MERRSGDPLVLPDDGRPTDWRRVWREAGLGIIGLLGWWMGFVQLPEEKEESKRG